MGSTQTFTCNNFSVTVSSCDETWIYSCCLQYGATFLLSVIFRNLKLTLISLSYKMGKERIFVPLISASCKSLCNTCMLSFFFNCTLSLSHGFPFVPVCFFLVFLVNHSINKRLRQFLVLFCEVHFSILYILQLDIVSNALERSGSLMMEALSQLGAHSVSFLRFLFAKSMTTHLRRVLRCLNCAQQGNAYQVAP
jgi:hypothetical protein